MDQLWAEALLRLFVEDTPSHTPLCSRQSSPQIWRQVADMAGGRAEMSSQQGYSLQQSHCVSWCFWSSWSGFPSVPSVMISFSLSDVYGWNWSSRFANKIRSQIIFYQVKLPRKCTYHLHHIKCRMPKSRWMVEPKFFTMRIAYLYFCDLHLEVSL